jgi:GWxTD domain-containing protein
VVVAFQADSGATRQFGRDETVRVHSFQETLRADESVIFQQFALVRPGVYTVAVVVRDRNSAAMARQQRPDTVPAFAGAGVGSPVPFYEGSGRDALSAFPKLLVSPRATLPYGADSLRVYVEAYGATPPARLAVRAVDDAGHDIWSDTVAARGDARLATAVLVLPAERLPIGQAALEVQLVGAAATARAPFLVSFSNQWVVNNFEQMVSLLRYFPHQDWVAKLREAPAEQRAQVWRDFWKATDPVPITPENEALDQYFERVQIATQRYREEGAPGWLTDRGEVFITLGDPDEVYDLSNEMGRGGVRVIRWTYTQLRLTLFFEDQSGFGRYRLTPTSRADYQNALARVRRAQ